MGVNDYFGNGSDSVKRQSEKERKKGNEREREIKGMRHRERDK